MMSAENIEIVSEETKSQRVMLPKPGEILARVWKWPLIIQVYLLVFAMLFVPVLWQVGKAWVQDENQAHGIFILPVSLFLLWIQRTDLIKAEPLPSFWGLIPLSLGLFLQVGSWLLQVQTQCFGIWALVLSLYGSMLILHGRELWRIARFPVLFLMMAGGIPGKIVQSMSLSLQHISSVGATFVMQILGFSVFQEGNVIQIPGYQLEVAEACSGIKKVVALFAFSLLYGYVFKISAGKRILLVLATVPIAIVANIARVSGLILVTNWGGTKALHIAHDWAEIVVLILSFFLFVGIGKLLGCKALRFSL